MRLWGQDMSRTGRFDFIGSYIWIALHSIGHRLSNIQVAVIKEGLSCLHDEV
jgi:hypothetical protein